MIVRAGYLFTPAIYDTFRIAALRSAFWNRIDCLWANYLCDCTSMNAAERRQPSWNFQYFWFIYYFCGRAVITCPEGMRGYTVHQRAVMLFCTSFSPILPSPLYACRPTRLWQSIQTDCFAINSL